MAARFCRRRSTSTATSASGSCRRSSSTSSGSSTRSSRTSRRFPRSTIRRCAACCSISGCRRDSRFITTAICRRDRASDRVRRSRSGCISAVRALDGRHVSKDELAQEAIHVEHDVLKEPVGAQDQISAAFGGFNHITFRPEWHVSGGTADHAARTARRAAGSPAAALHRDVANAAEIARTQIENLRNRQSELRAHAQMVERAIEILRSQC